MANLMGRLWAAVEKTESCWLYRGFCDPTGYGIISDGTGPHRNKRVHRLSWEQHYGPIPDGMLVCHHCDVRNCIRPDHLFVGTEKDNTDDMVSKGRALFQTDPERLRQQGSKHGESKLTEEQVIEIRRLRAEGKRQWEIAQQFGVTRGLIGHIVRRQAWAHV